MKIIFDKGKKLYDIENRDLTDNVMAHLGLDELYDWQKETIMALISKAADNENDYEIYGDHFHIHLTPKNFFEGNCALSITDFDDNYEPEGNVAISFSKGELSQFIHMLEEIKNNMD